MSKSLLLLAGALGTTIACSIASKSGPASSEAPFVPSASSQRGVNTTRYYEDTCAKCHGVNGEGGGGGTKSLLTVDKFDQKWDRAFFDAIRKGVPEAGMEAYEGAISDAEIWAQVVHIRELQAKAIRRQIGGPKQQNGVYTSKYGKYRIETVVDTDKGLRTPWAIDWLPDGKMLVTNRPGTMFVFDGPRQLPVENLPPVVELGQGGLMEVTVHPKYRQNGWVYLALTDPARQGRGGLTKIVRGKLRFAADKALWTNEQTIYKFEDRFYNGSGVHFGCRIVFDGKGHIFFSVGERGSQELAQDLTRPNGKVYRINEDGSVPSDNPFNTQADRAKGVIPAIWSYGHRNPQGLTLLPNGELWDTEHGPRGGDELNLVQKGANYGWPLVAFSINYNDLPLSVPWPTKDQKIKMPAFRWLPSIGACGLDYVRGSAFPAWNGDLMAGGLSGANVDRIRVKDGKLVEREEIMLWQGRVRDVSTAPDGTVYVALNQPDKIVRIVPVK